MLSREFYLKPFCETISGEIYLTCWYQEDKKCKTKKTKNRMRKLKWVIQYWGKKKKKYQNREKISEIFIRPLKPQEEVQLRVSECVYDSAKMAWCFYLS